MTPWRDFIRACAFYRYSDVVRLPQLMLLAGFKDACDAKRDLNRLTVYGGEELRKEEWLRTLKFWVGHIQIGYLQRVVATKVY